MMTWPSVFVVVAVLLFILAWFRRLGGPFIVFNSGMNSGRIVHNHGDKKETDGE